jgi:lipopolysaccharide transport system ATP-binding protein
VSAPPAIAIENLSKRYVLARRRDGTGLRHLLEGFIKAPFSKRERGAGTEEFWALRDLSCGIEHGEVVAIIGCNGAGKSTLLKILSRITEPTAGRVRLRGRVASLLEVGTGFHPELTGRENIFLNGAILGMTRSETRQRFDEIVAFAEIDRFLDTPVKRYSSGMYVRLAFAVAAHLEPEILLVDEVLAVGDAAFQKKCLGKMSEISRGHGRTVILVSHNMSAVRSLCSRAIYLAEGSLALDGTPEQCIAAYLSDNFDDKYEWRAVTTSVHPVQVTSLVIQGGDPLGGRVIDAARGFELQLEFEVRQRIGNAVVEVWLLTADGIHLLTLGDHDSHPELLAQREPGKYRVKVRVPGNLLNTGTYFLRINSGLANLRTFDHVDALRFQVTEALPHPSRQHRRGYILPMLPWETMSVQPLEGHASKAA